MSNNNESHYNCAVLSAGQTSIVSGYIVLSRYLVAMHRNNKPPLIANTLQCLQSDWIENLSSYLQLCTFAVKADEVGTMRVRGRTHEH